MSLLIISGYLVLSGVALAVVTYFIYQKILAGKIVIYLFTKDRALYRRLVKPGTLNEIQIDECTYVYDERAIFYTPAGILRQPKPALIFHRDQPSPIDMFKPANARRNEVSSQELSSMMNDSSVRDFVSAQSSINPKQLLSAVIVCCLATIVTSIAAAYYVIYFLTDGKGFSQLLGGQ